MATGLLTRALNIHLPKTHFLSLSFQVTPLVQFDLNYRKVKRLLAVVNEAEPLEDQLFVFSVEGGKTQVTKIKEGKFEVVVEFN